MFLSERQKELTTGLFGILLIGLTFIAGEGGLRVINLMKFGTVETAEKSALFHRDPATGLRVPRPGASRGRITINSLGFRGPEIPIDKPPSTIRIAFLGSSTTFDAQVKGNDATWPHRTWQQLQDAYPGCRFDYINGGVPGFSLTTSTAQYQTYVARLAPDVVVIYSAEINGDTADRAQELGIYGGTHQEKSWLATYSLLWQKIEKNLQVIKQQRAAHRNAGKLDVDWRALSRDFEGRLEKLVDDLVADSALPVLVTVGGHLSRRQSPKDQVVAANTALFYMPYMSIEGLLDARDAYNAAIAEVAARRNAVLIDQEDLIPADPLHYADSAHFTDLGSEVMAKRVGDALLASPAFLEQVKRTAPGCIETAS